MDLVRDVEIEIADILAQFRQFGQHFPLSGEQASHREGMNLVDLVQIIVIHRRILFVEGSMRILVFR
jgi:hypothetical protein